MSDDFENDLTGSYVRFVGDGLDGEVSISPSPEGGAPIRKPVSPSEDNLQRLYALFRPLRLVMGCLGLWHPSLDDLQQAPPAHRCTSTTRFLFLGLSVANMTYSFCNFALLFLSRPAGRITSWEWSVYVVLVIWPLQACLMTLLHFWLFEWEFVGALWRVWAEAVTVRIGAEQWERLGRLRNLYMAGAVAATALLTGFVLIGMTSSGQAGAFLHTFLSFDFSTPLMVVNFTVLTMVIVATASFTTVFFVLHCHIVAGSLMSVYASMERRVTNNTVFTENVLVGERDMSVLEYFRQQRNWSKKMVDAMDRAFRHISFLNYLANVPLIVFIMYALITHIRDNPLMIGACCVSILAAFAQVAAVSFAAAWIHKWASKPKELLHDMRIPKGQYPNLSDTASLTLLLDEVGEEYIGVTAWRLVVITKKFIVTALGLIISYIIILYEFGHLNEVLQHVEELSASTKRITSHLQGTQLGARNAT